MQLPMREMNVTGLRKERRGGKALYRQYDMLLMELCEYFKSD